MWSMNTATQPILPDEIHNSFNLLCWLAEEDVVCLCFYGTLPHYVPPISLLMQLP